MKKLVPSWTPIIHCAFASDLTSEPGLLLGLEMPAKSHCVGYLFVGSLCQNANENLHICKLDIVPALEIHKISKFLQVSLVFYTNLHSLFLASIILKE